MVALLLLVPTYFDQLRYPITDSNMCHVIGVQSAANVSSLLYGGKNLKILKFSLKMFVVQLV